MKSALCAGVMAISVSFVANYAYAQSELPAVKVVASKYFTKQEQTGKSITVIPDSLIRANYGKSLSEILSLQAGLQVNGAGQSPGSIQTLYMRGASSGLTLILLNGVPVYDASSIEGGFDLNLIPLASVERIEILRGGQSTLYGSDAVAGIVNIITHKGSGEKIELNAGLNVGSFKTIGVNVGVRGFLKKFGYQVNYSGDRSNGFSSATILDKDNEENDGLSRSNLNVNTNYQLAKANLRLGAILSNYRADLDAAAFNDDSDYTSETKNSQWNAGMDFNFKKSDLVLNYLFSEIGRSYLDDSLDVPLNAFNKYSRSNYNTESHFAELYYKLTLSNSLNFLFGSDFRKQNTLQNYYSVSSFGPFEDAPILPEVANIENSSIYTDLNFKTEAGFGVEAGARFNHHSVYKNKMSWSLNPYWLPRSGLKLFGTVANSFKNPSLYHLFSPYGNPELQPETSINGEFGVRIWKPNQQKFVQFVGYIRKTQNLFFFQNLNDFPYGQYQNLGEQTDKGLELEAGLSHKKWSAQLNYSLLNGRLTSDKSFREAAYNLTRRPRNAFNIITSYAFNPKLTANVTFKYLGKREDKFYNDAVFATETVYLKQVLLVNMRLNYNPNSNLLVFAELKNATNQLYYEVYGYNSEPINFKTGVNFTL